MPGLLPRLFAGALAAALGGLIGLLVAHERGAGYRFTQQVQALSG